MKVREIKYAYGKSLEAETIDSPSAVAELMRRIMNPSREQFVVFYMNNKNVTAYWDIVSVGTVSETIVHPREIFRSAIKHGASSIIMCHNHPAGNPNPSTEDRSVTKRLVASGALLGIPVVDHVVVGDTTHYSFKEEGEL